MTQKLKHGDVRADGYAFQGYNNGYEQWCSPASYRRVRIRRAWKNALKRASERAIPFDIDLDYLVSIYPPDSNCPVLGIPMVWGGTDGVSNSPSLDRLDPDLGYTRGNVCWISNRANTLKSNATVAEIENVLNYMKANSTNNVC